MDAKVYSNDFDEGYNFHASMALKLLSGQKLTIHNDLSPVMLHSTRLLQCFYALEAALGNPASFKYASAHVLSIRPSFIQSHGLLLVLILPIGGVVHDATIHEVIWKHGLGWSSWCNLWLHQSLVDGV